MDALQLLLLTLTDHAHERHVDGNEVWYDYAPLGVRFKVVGQPGYLRVVETMALEEE